MTARVSRTTRVSWGKVAASVSQASKQESRQSSGQTIEQASKRGSKRAGKRTNKQARKQASKQTKASVCRYAHRVNISIAKSTFESIIEVPYNLGSILPVLFLMPLLTINIGKNVKTTDDIASFSVLIMTLEFLLHLRRFARFIVEIKKVKGSLFLLFFNFL